MSRRINENKSLKTIIEAFVSSNNLEEGLDKVNVKEAWVNTMGPGVNKYTTAIEFKKNTLYVQLSSSALREELSYGIEQIMKQLNKYIEKDVIKKLILR